MFEKISRSWALAGECWDVLKEDPALLIFPLLSSLAMLVLLASFALPVWTVYHHHQLALADGSGVHTTRTLSYAVIYVFYVISYSIVMFFNTALIAVALRRLDGEPASVEEGLQAALSNLPAILGYALIAATVGTMLRAIEQRVGIVGRIVTSIIGAAWTLATAMTLPVLVVEGVGPVEAISRSLDLLQENWGENLIGNGGISVGIAVIAIPLWVIAAWFMMFAISTKSLGTMVLAAIVLLVTVVGLSLVSATLHAIYTAALYRFATGNKDNGGIRQDLLAEAFQRI
ncbi:MAG: DUF6159 family protein [Steroidobacteraceae bacterium]